MPAAEARVETERASRYLAQLCQHVTSINAKGCSSFGGAPDLGFAGVTGLMGVVVEAGSCFRRWAAKSR